MAVARYGVRWAADLFLLRGEISRGGEASLIEARLAGDGTTVSASVSMVSSPIGSTSAAFGVSSAACSPDWSGVTGIAVSSATSSTGASSTVNGRSNDMAMVGAAADCDGSGAYRWARSASARQVAARATRLEVHPVCVQSPQALFKFQSCKLLDLDILRPTPHAIPRQGPNSLHPAVLGACHQTWSSFPADAKLGRTATEPCGERGCGLASVPLLLSIRAREQSSSAVIDGLDVPDFAL